MLMQGFILTIVGMSVVFLFLTILVLAMGSSSWIINKYLPEPVPAGAAPAQITSGASSEKAAVAVAVAACARARMLKLENSPANL